jgi:hypothetical protein
MCNWTIWNIKEKRATNEVRRTHNDIDDGSAKMPMARLQTQRNGKVKISKANAWRMVSNTTTNRETAADHTPCHVYITTLKKLGFEQEKEQLREWMTVASQHGGWGTNVELIPSSYS